IMHPSSGSVHVMGYVPWLDRKNYVSKIGAIFGQKSQLFFDIPPIDAFYLNKAIYQIPDADFHHNLNKMADLLKVQHVMKKPTRLLSLGERMKCEFIMSMLHSPKIVFLDEPTIGLDVSAKEKIREFILEMNKSGVTFILTTHDLGDVEHLAKRVIFINNGEIVFDNSLQSLKKHLGTIQQISLSTAGLLPDLNLSGINITNKVSDYEVEIELNYDIMNLDNFINYINKTSSIRDMFIKDLPIEKIVLDLYK
ncbi:MAG TPA: AAA family ATPase, partial [Bacilli bacterium]